MSERRTIEDEVASRDPRRVSRTCEVWLDDRGSHVCRKPTAFWYPSYGGGTMALCTDHAAKHQSSASQIGLTALAAASRPSERSEKR